MAAKRASDECLNGDSRMDLGPSPAVETVNPEDGTMIIRPPPISILPAGDMIAGAVTTELTSIVAGDLLTGLVIAINSVSEIAGGVTTELTSIVAGELPSGLVVARNSVLEGGGNNDDLRINIDQHVNVPTYESTMQLITRALRTVGLLTLVMVVRTMLYKPASGVFFGQNKLAYYVILAVIFAIGVGEVTIAFWISQSGYTRRGFWIWRCVLFISIWPFIVILSMGGFT